MRLGTQYYIAGICFILPIILDSIECAIGSDNKGNFLKLSGTAKKIARLRTSLMAMKMTKLIGFAPLLKEDNAEVLLDLVLNEGDLIKLSAYNKLYKLYQKSESEENNKVLIVALMRAAAELIRYYNANGNYIKAMQTHIDGLNYLDWCLEIWQDKSVCYKYIIMLLEPFLSCYVITIDSDMKTRFPDYFKKAIESLPNDKMLRFIKTKIGCQFKLALDNTFVKKIKVLGLEPNFEEFDCKKELLELKDDLNEIGTYDRKYYYLLGKTYENDNLYNNAIEQYTNGRNLIVYDSKTSSMNKILQESIEKLYLRDHADL